MYKYKVFIEKVKCRDTESLHGSDKLIITGLVVTDKEHKGYALPLMRINTDEERYPNTLVFEGNSDVPNLGIALQATDIDENDGWYENKDNIIKLASEVGAGFATYLSANPEAGAETGEGIKKALPILGEVITFFTKKDKNDNLGQFSTSIGFENLPFGESQVKSLAINFNEHDDYIPTWPFGSIYVDYNDFTYDFTLRIECEKTFGENENPIYKKYKVLGGERGFLGTPSTNETICPDGQGHFVHFQSGSIYWHSNTGAFEVHGDIRLKWAKLSWEKGVLGYPITDENPTPNGKGRYNHFQNGSIFWTPKYGAFEVHGAIRDKWASLGWENSSLGFPISDEFTDSDGITKVNKFEGGKITWSQEKGCIVHYPFIKINLPFDINRKSTKIPVKPI